MSNNKAALSTKAVRTCCPPSPNQFFISLHETDFFIRQALDGHQKDELKHILHFLRDLYLLKTTAMDCKATHCTRYLQKACQG